MAESQIYKINTLAVVIAKYLDVNQYGESLLALQN